MKKYLTKNVCTPAYDSKMTVKGKIITNVIKKMVINAQYNNNVNLHQSLVAVLLASYHLLLLAPHTSLEVPFSALLDPLQPFLYT